jgi:hypothetical protein
MASMQISRDYGANASPLLVWEQIPPAGVYTVESDDGAPPAFKSNGNRIADRLSQLFRPQEEVK